MLGAAVITGLRKWRRKSACGYSTANTASPRPTPTTRGVYVFTGSIMRIILPRGRRRAGARSGRSYCRASAGFFFSASSIRLSSATRSQAHFSSASVRLSARR